MFVVLAVVIVICFFNIYVWFFPFFVTNYNSFTTCFCFLFYKLFIYIYIKTIVCFLFFNFYYLPFFHTFNKLTLLPCVLFFVILVALQKYLFRLGFLLSVLFLFVWCIFYSFIPLTSFHSCPLSAVKYCVVLFSFKSTKWILNLTNFFFCF